MRLTKLGHACVRLNHDADGSGPTLVIDPGSLTEPGALHGADAVLISHEHFDHLDVERLRAATEADPALAVWTNHAVAEQLAWLGRRVHAVGDGDTFSAAGFEIAVHGRQHAVIHRDLPVVPNVGFLVDGELFHPGDAFTVPGVAVPTVLVPTSGPWMKAAEMIDYLRELRPRRAYGVHEGLLNDVGLGLVDNLLARVAGELDADIRQLRSGESVDLGTQPAA